MARTKTSILNQIKRDKAYWEVISAKLGWTLVGHTFQMSARFDTGGDEQLTLTYRQREAICRAFGDDSIRDPFSTRQYY